MLKHLTLENFKAFGRKTKIELAPITLIFGENSAGKSSILQSLNLLKQTHESGQSGAALLPRIDGGFVELGSYHELIFDHNAKKKLRIGLSAQSQKARTSVFSGIPGCGLEIAFRRNARNGEVVVSEFIITHENSMKPVAKFKIRKATKKEQKELTRYGRYGVMRGRIRSSGKPALDTVAECTHITEEEQFWQPIYEEWFSRRSDVVKYLKKELDNAAKHNRSGLTARNEEEQVAAVKSSLDFYSRHFGLGGFVERVAAAGIGHTVLMDGFFPEASPISRMWKQLPELEMVYAGRAPGTGRRIKKYFDIGAFAYFTGREIASALEMMFPMGPLRRTPERWYIFTGTSPVDVGYQGDHLPDLLYQNPALVKKANSWLAKLDIGYQLKVIPVGDKKHSDLFEVRLVDSRREGEVEVALSDVGFGISQILPFLVQSLASERRIISIEQPEVHIHPRLQADLGDLIAEGVKKPHFHQYLIETHSEHLILRIQKLVRNGSLEPKDVSILYVSRGSNGSSVERLRLDDNGDFIDDWPGGFFSERLRELR